MSLNRPPQGPPGSIGQQGDRSARIASSSAGAAARPGPTGFAAGTRSSPAGSRGSLSLGELEPRFERALRAIHPLFQPIVTAEQGLLFGHEALLRARDPDLPDPASLLDAAERLHRVERLGRTIRRQVAARFAGAPADHGLLFVNLHALDLPDKSLSSPYTPLTKMRERVVLEITERASLEAVSDVRFRVAELRAMGYRVAIDDLGAGHDRMHRFTLNDCDFVKLDMSLVRSIDQRARVQRTVASIIAMCRDQGIQVVGEGVETTAERDTLIALGCDLLQGFLIARPGPDLGLPDHH